MGRTTVDATTDRVGAGGVISDGDLPTRLLVFGLARHDGTIPASDVFAVADVCHRSTEQVRSCLRRLVGEGLFTRDGVGQRAVYRPTAAGLQALTAFGGRALQAHLQDTDDRPWDGRWHLVGFAVPESRRAARDALRDRLGELGGAAVHNGLYVRPDAWEPEVLAAAARWQVTDHITVATSDDLAVGGRRDPRAIAAHLWSLDAVAAGYRAFLDRWSPVLDGLGTMRRRHERLPESAYLPGALAMGLAYRRCLEADPLLPEELLPHPWPGRAARDLLIGSRRLAMQVRDAGDRPALFATFADMVDDVVPRSHQGGPT